MSTPVVDYVIRARRPGAFYAGLAEDETPIPRGNPAWLFVLAGAVAMIAGGVGLMVWAVAR